MERRIREYALGWATRQAAGHLAPVPASAQTDGLCFPPARALYCHVCCGHENCESLVECALTDKYCVITRASEYPGPRRPHPAPAAPHKHFLAPFTSVHPPRRKLSVSPLQILGTPPFSGSQFKLGLTIRWEEGWIQAGMLKILTSHPGIPGPSGPFLLTHTPVSNQLTIASAPGYPAMTLEFNPAADQSSLFPDQALSFVSHHASGSLRSSGAELGPRACVLGCDGVQAWCWGSWRQGVTYLKWPQKNAWAYQTG